MFELVDVIGRGRERAGDAVPLTVTEVAGASKGVLQYEYGADASPKTRVRRAWSDGAIHVIGRGAAWNDCDFVDPVLFIAFPIVSGATHEGGFESQAGCQTPESGSWSVTIGSLDETEDASGEVWETLLVSETVNTETSLGSIIVKTTYWFSLELGVEVKRARQAEATIRGSTDSSGDTILLLRHP